MNTIEDKLSVIYSIYDSIVDKRLKYEKKPFRGKAIIVVASILSSIIGVLSMFREMAGENNRTLTATFVLLWVVLLLYSLFCNYLTGRSAKAMSILLLSTIGYSVVCFFVSMITFVWGLFFLFCKALGSIKAGDGTPASSGTPTFVSNTGRVENLRADGNDFVDSVGRRYKKDDNGDMKRDW